MVPCEQSGHRVTGGRRAGAYPLARLGLVPDDTDRVAPPPLDSARSAARLRRGDQIFDDHLLIAGRPREFVAGAPRWRYSTGLDSAGVPKKLLRVADECRVGHHGAVKRDDRRQAFGHRTVQRAPGLRAAGAVGTARSAWPASVEPGSPITVSRSGPDGGDCHRPASYARVLVDHLMPARGGSFR